MNTLQTKGTAGSAFSSVMGTVNSAAVAIGSTFDVLTTGVGMAHKFVADASGRQNIRSTIENHLYISEAKAEAGLRKMKLNDSVREFVGTDSNRQSEWKQIETEINSLFGEAEAA